MRYIVDVGRIVVVNDKTPEAAAAAALIERIQDPEAASSPAPAYAIVHEPVSGATTYFRVSPPPGSDRCDA